MKIKELIGEEAYKAIPEDKRKELDKQDFEDISGGKYVPKKRLDDKIADLKEMQKQKEAVESQLESLKGIDAEGLKAKIEELQNENAATKKQFEDTLKKRDFDDALRNQLKEYNPKNLKLVETLLNHENLKLVDGKIIGLDEQMKSIKKDNEYLFNKVVNTGSFGTGAQGGDTGKQGNNEVNWAEKAGKARAENLKSAGLKDFFAGGK